MLEALELRTLIIGNSGSGKSGLAEGLGELVGAPVFHLDLLHWKDNGVGAKEDENLARQNVASLAATERWVIEGVYGWLAEAAIPRATALIWLDLSWDVCREGVARARSASWRDRG
jgi:adenylate kinase family enzyme